MPDSDGSRSFYFFDIDDNLLFLPTVLYLWNAERGEELTISSGEFAAIQNSLGRAGKWQAWTVRDETFRDFRDQADAPISSQTFMRDLERALGGSAWKGPSWPLLEHAAAQSRAIAMVTARGHAPQTIQSGLELLVARGHLAGVPPILGIYPVTHPSIRAQLDPANRGLTVPSIKKLAIKDAVNKALALYGDAAPHRFGMSDDDPNNVALAISAMRDCKIAHPRMRFFVINTNHDEFVKLEVFPMNHPVTAPAKSLLSDTPEKALTYSGNASIYVSDMSRAIAFYTDVLGLRLRLRIADEWAELDAGGGLVLGLHVAQAGRTVAPGTAGAINVELATGRSLTEVVAELTARGCRFAGEIEQYPNVHLVSLLDPDNNIVIIARQTVKD